MSYRHHGFTSMVLFSVAVILALWVVARSSWWWAGGYAALNLLATAGIAWCYCAKCLCRQTKCSHVLVGKVADVLPRRAPGPYTTWDYLGMLAASGVVFVYPLYWLWRQPLWLAVYVAVFFLAGAEIFFAVCPHCGNARCPASRWRRRKAFEDHPTSTTSPPSSSS